MKQALLWTCGVVVLLLILFIVGANINSKPRTYHEKVSNCYQHAEMNGHSDADRLSIYRECMRNLAVDAKEERCAKYAPYPRTENEMDTKDYALCIAAGQ